MRRLASKLTFWLLLLPSLVLLKIHCVIIQDVNSPNQINDYWNYLQLRPADSYTTPNSSLTLNVLSTAYYGSSDYVKMITDANPALQSTNPTSNLASGTTVIFPPFMKCLDYMPITCLQQPFVVTGKLPTITVTTISTSQSTGDYNDDRLLEQDYYDEFDDEAEYGGIIQLLPHKLVSFDSWHLAVRVTNFLSFPITPSKFAGAPIQPFMDQLFEQDVLPYISIASGAAPWTLTFQSFTTLFAGDYTISLQIYLPPMVTYPFLNIGSPNSVVATATTSTSGFTSLISSSISQSDGRVSTLSSLASSSSNLNITLTIFTDSSNHVFVDVILDEYYGMSTLTKKANTIYNLVSKELNYLSVELLTTNPYNSPRSLFTNITIYKPLQGWRFIPIYGNYFRIISVSTGQAITYDPDSITLQMEDPHHENDNQYWLLIPHGIASDNIFQIKFDSQSCWSVIQSTMADYFEDCAPIELVTCIGTDAKQQFTLTEQTTTSVHSNYWLLT